MAVFNGEKYVSKAIRSILNQTYQDFEFIIIEDGSLDKSLEIVKEYAKKDNRIKIIRNDINIGLTKCLNKAINLANGIFIARQDVDDISLPKRLEYQMTFLSNNPDYSFCGCNGISKQTRQTLVNSFNNDEIKKNLILKNCFAHPSIIIRKEVFKKYGLYNEKYLYAQDYELWCRFIYKYRLKAKNLRDRLIIMNMPFERLLEKDNYKFLTQTKNKIKTKLKYFRYCDIKFRVLISIFNDLIEFYYVLIFKGYKRVK